MRYRLRWPDGSCAVCYSPSLVIAEHLRPGVAYPLADFLARNRAALLEASARVRAKYGFPCARALQQLAEIETRAKGFAGTADATVAVLAFDHDVAPPDAASEGGRR
jgi:uncharacterized repeat protein (TIGR04042 family)